MTAIIGACLFGLVAVITTLAALGAPVGDFTMGGEHKVLPSKFRIFALVSLIIQVFAILIILQAGSFIPLWFSKSVTKIICIFFASYLVLNTQMNFLSKSKKEKYVLTPISIAASVCFWIAAFSI